MADAYLEKLALSVFGQEINSPLERSKLIANALVNEQYDIVVLQEFVDEDLRYPIEHKLIVKNNYHQSQLLGASYFVLNNLLYLYNGGGARFLLGSLLLKKMSWCCQPLVCSVRQL